PNDLDDEDPDHEQKHTDEMERRVVAVIRVGEKDLRRPLGHEQQEQASRDEVAREVVQAQVRALHAWGARAVTSIGAWAGRPWTTGTGFLAASIAAPTKPSKSGCGRSG